MTVSAEAAILPPKGTPLPSVLAAVEKIIASGSTQALSALRDAAGRRIDLTSAIAVNLLRQGRADDAKGMIERFIADTGPSVEAYDALGAIQLGADDAESAIAAFRAALEIDPRAENPASNLYNLFINLKRFQEATDLRHHHPQARDGAPERTIRHAQRLMQDADSPTAALLLEPLEESADAQCYLGEAYFRCGRRADGYEAWKRALAITPDHFQTHIKQAIGLQLDGKFDEALESLAVAEQQNETSLSVRTTKAAILVGLKKYKDAVDILEDIEKNADAWAVLSSAYVYLGNGDAAKKAAYKSLELEENNFFGRQNLVLALLRCHDNKSAEREARKTIELIEAGYYKLGISETAILHNQADALGQSLARQGLADLSHEFRRKYAEDVGVSLQFFQNYLFEMHYAANPTPDFIAQEHRKITRVLPPEIPHEYEVADPEKPLKIGLLSADFRHHSCGYFMFTLLTGLKRRGVEVHCVATIHGTEDDLTERFRDTADGWIDIRELDDVAARERIMEEKIDILVDCIGYTAGSRPGLLSMRAAPVQVTWLGYPDGSGIPAVDYRFTDQHAEPPEADRLYVETLVRLPHGFLCFPEYDGAPEVAPTPALEKGWITFGSFNAVPKINDEVIRLWCDILNKTPNARLLLKSAYVEEEVVENMKQRFYQHGVSPEQLELTPWTPSKIAHLALYNSVDINLDPFPYNGTTTTMEATFMGVPSVALRGDRHSGLVGAALNTRFGVPELVADTEDDYVRIAVDLAADLERLNVLRLGLRDRMRASDMMNADSFAGDVDEAFRMMWRKRCAAAGATVDATASDSAALDFRTRGGVTIAAPASIREMTTYVLLEQEDWFESDLGFLRRCATPGWRVIDIGANYGLYALNLAHAAGADGRVAAFEPSARTASFLRRSIDRNGFADRVTLIQAAMSDSEGEATLDTSAAELKALTKTGLGETVRTLTLDGWAAAAGFGAPDFVKIDAEGAEPSIIDGGARFFADASPLVMIEVKHGASIEFDALAKLEAHGYRAFALIPGLDALAPANPRAPRGAAEAIDGYLLNLFLAKPDTARALAQRGKLVAARIEAPGVDPEQWAAAITTKPYWASFRALEADFRDPAKALPGQGRYRSALARFAAFEAATDAPVRLAHLERAVTDMEQALAYRRTADRLASAARIFAAAGRREPAMRAMRETKLALTRLDLVLSEPFLAPLERFDAIDAGGDFISWFEAAALEAYELLSAFSSCFRNEDATSLFAAIADNPFTSEEMRRRRQLSAIRRRRQTEVEPDPRLAGASAGHLNPEMWATPRPAWL